MLLAIVFLTAGNMTMFPRVPINPCLNFGEPLAKVCRRGRLHPGLKELFTKAYFSAQQDECLFYEEDLKENKLDVTTPGVWMVTILKFSQGSVALRLALKSRLETGRWLLPLQVPPAAPLWLIRHFLGRLPTPLMLCCVDDKVCIEKCRSEWINISVDCKSAMRRLSFNHKIHGPLQERLALALDDMMLEARLLFISLITLIRNLSCKVSKGWIDEQAVAILVEYFIPSLVSRPYFPGHLTKDDKRCLAAVRYLCFNLPEVKEQCKEAVAEAKVSFPVDSMTYSLESQMDKMLVRSTSEKSVELNDQKQIFSKEVNPFLKKCHTAESEDVCSKESSMELDKKKKEPHEILGSLPLVLDLRKNEKDLSHSTSNASLVMDKKNEPLPECKTVATHPSVLVLSNTTEKHNVSEGFSALSNPKNTEEKVNDESSTTFKKCQAIKLAYKLRGQWMAWRLAGLFIEGSLSPISGVGYTRLTQDSLY